ncbi:hypothetical protein [Shewanella atlantica]|uniref:Uncharacterized protein n=1 Tax=Shewanella atlantica TaxID=271099 RepID=A0A431WGV9_9GAMM|nr:hypothetical protein [Shewanella atlantica]RTR34698.1 hypothetical protein EKG39_03295 [Shewanella atlantica]
MPPSHHKEIANFLRENTEGAPSVSAYRDNNNSRPIPIGQFGKDFFSTIGAFDMGLRLPSGNFEFAAVGTNQWLPNSVASSIYWLGGRECSEWPLVCEDVVKHNARSTYRHIAYVPSIFSLKLSTGQVINWLLGVPITDNEIGISEKEALERAQQKYPRWLFSERA